MIRFILTVLTLALAPAAWAELLVLRNVNVITLERPGEVLAGRDLVIRDGLIESLDGEFEGTPNQEIDGQGGFVMPGLAEMHAHIPNSANRQQMEEVLTLYLSQGITTVRGMLGEPGHLEARDAQLNGELDAPRILAGGPSLNGRSVTSPRQAVTLVEAQVEAGYDHLKLHPGLSPEAFDAIAATARRHDIRFVGHVSPSYGARHALEAGQTTIDHLDGLIEALIPEDSEGADLQGAFFGINLARHADALRLAELARALDQADAWVVPTETLMVSYAGPDVEAELTRQPGLEYVSASVRENWRASRARLISDPAYDAEGAREWLALRLTMIKAFHDQGRRVLLGSDAPQVYNVPGFSIHRELALYVDAGLSPQEALETGTVNVARYLGAEDRRGRLRPGLEADLVLLADNPLQDIAATRSVRGVMVMGRWSSREDLDRRLAAIADRHGNP